MEKLKSDSFFVQIVTVHIVHGCHLYSIFMLDSPYADFFLEMLWATRVPEYLDIWNPSLA
jgi:hypothetical protein